MRRTTVRVPLMALAAALAVTGDLAAGAAAAAPDTTAPDSTSPNSHTQKWQENLAAGTATGARHTDGKVVLDADTSHGTGWTGGAVEAYHTFPARTLTTQANRIGARLTADVPAGTTVQVDVRATRPDGRWTEWQPVTADTPAVAPFAATRIQVRLVLTRAAGAGGVTPAVSALALTADTVTGTAAVTPQAAPTWRVYATREGLVGHTTANGHVIRSNDRFVALPSRRALNANDGVRDYKVRVCNPGNGRCVDEPVFDVGPWNTRDDYWNPANVRENWANLPQGKPEATAAYFQDYNGGRDQYGRLVSNPSGIDLADGTWAALGMTGNNPVDVTYLWKG